MSSLPELDAATIAAPSAEAAIEAPTSEGAGIDRRLGPMIRTMGALLSVQAVTWLTSLVGVLIVPRLLGAEGLGLFGSGATAIMIFARIAGMGTTSYVTREVAKEPSRAAHLVVNALVTRVGLMGFFTAAALAAGFVFGLSFANCTILLALSLGATVGLVTEVLMGALQGNQHLGRAALVGSCVGVGSQFASVAILIAHGGVLGLVLVSMAAAFLIGGMTIVIFVQHFGWTWDWSARAAIGLARNGLPFLAWDLGLLVYGSIDFILVPALSDTATGGQYVLAYRVASIPIFVATVATSAVYPALSAAVADAEWFRKVLTRASVLTVSATLPMAAGLALVSPWVTREIGGGSEFQRAVPLIAILCLHIPLAAADAVQGAALFARDRQKTLALTAWVAAFVNPLCNLVAIPLTVRLWSNGAIGAACVTVATEIGMSVVIWSITLKWLDGGALRTGALRAVAATGCMALVVGGVLQVANPVFAIPVGMVVYGVCALLFGVVSREELAAAKSAFGRGAAVTESRYGASTAPQLTDPIVQE